jgi:hypothetical protein
MILAKCIYVETKGCYKEYWSFLLLPNKFTSWECKDTARVALRVLKKSPVNRGRWICTPLSIMRCWFSGKLMF